MGAINALEDPKNATRMRYLHGLYSSYRRSTSPFVHFGVLSNTKLCKREQQSWKELTTDELNALRRLQKLLYQAQSWCCWDWSVTSVWINIPVIDEFAPYLGKSRLTGKILLSNTDVITDSSKKTFDKTCKEWFFVVLSFLAIQALPKSITIYDSSESRYATLWNRCTGRNRVALKLESAIAQTRAQWSPFKWNNETSNRQMT